MIDVYVGEGQFGIRGGGCLSDPRPVCPAPAALCCPLLTHNDIACIPPEGVTVADLLKDDKKKRKFCGFRQRRAKDHGKWLRLNFPSGDSCPEASGAFSLHIGLL